MAKCQFRANRYLRLCEHKFTLESNPQRHDNSDANPRRNWCSIHHLVRDIIVHVCESIHRKRFNDHRRSHHYLGRNDTFWNLGSCQLRLRILLNLQHRNIRCAFLDDVSIWANQGVVTDWLLHVLEGAIEYLELPKYTYNFQHQRCTTRRCTRGIRH